LIAQRCVTRDMGR